MSSSTGRSPYPTRSRRRQQILLQQQQQAAAAAAQHAAAVVVVPTNNNTNSDPMDESTSETNNAANNNNNTNDTSATTSPQRLSIGVRNNLITTTTTTPLMMTTTTATTNTTSTSASSSTGNYYMMGQNLVQARLSPANAATSSTSANNRSGTTSSSSSRRFFDWNNTSTTSVVTTPSGLGAASAAKMMSMSSMNNNNNNDSKNNANHHLHRSGNMNHSFQKFGGPPPPPQRVIPPPSSSHYQHQQHQQQQPDICIDGINLTHLRRLTQSCLGTKTSCASNSMAVFYSSIIYAKTQSSDDAFVYAQCLLKNNEPKRCVRLLETTKFTKSIKQQIEATLLATEALASLNEWQTVLALLEDPLQYTSTCNSTTTNTSNSMSPNPNTSSGTSLLLTTSPPLEDDDDIGWQALAQSIPLDDEEDCYNNHDQNYNNNKNNKNTNRPTNYGSSMVVTTTPSSIHPLARICCWRGQAYAETGHPLRAATYWKRALTIDPLCVQALDYLLDRSVCPYDQALEVILHLNFPPSEDMDWLRALYLARVHVAAPKSTVGVGVGIGPAASTTAHHDTTAGGGGGGGGDDLMKSHKMTTNDPFWQEASSIQLSSPMPITNPELSSDKIFTFGESNGTKNNNNYNNSKESSTDALVESSLDTLWNTHKLNKSSEVLAMSAKRAYRRHDLRNALQYCQELAQVDPLCQTAGFVYVSTLVALKHKRELFRLAHEWVDAAPKSAKAWFAVGAYYYTCERYHVAQRHFCRATRLDPHCSEAWIAFGTSFAACDESDQALASFRAAQRLAPGDHTSLLYIGMEYLRTNHLTLAQHFLQAAHRSSSGTDALCKNELGVLCMAQKNYNAAIRWFLKALVNNTGGEKGGGGGGSSNDSSSTITIDDIPNSTMLDEYWEPTLFNLGQAYRKNRNFAEASKCFEKCLTISESASAYAALAFCKHLQGDYDTAIDTYHQSLSRKPDDPFCTEMLHRCLQDALEQPHFIGDIAAGAAPVAAPTPGRRHPTNNNALFGGKQQGQHRQSTTPNNANNQSLWTDDGEGLSISVETSSDVDMG